MNARITIAIIAGVLGATPIVARAQASPPVGAVAQARVLSDSGRALHDVGEYDLAIEAFRRAYQLDPRPALIFNLAQAYRLDGDCATSSDLYRSYLERDPDGETRALAEQNLAVAAGCAEHPGRGLRRAGLATAIGGGIVLGVGVYDADRLGTALVVTGGAAVLTGAVLYLLGRRAERNAPALSLSMSPGLRDAGVRLSWDF